MSEISRFCHTVSLIVPEPKRSAMSAKPCMRALSIRPTGSTTPDIGETLLALRVHADMAVAPLRRGGDDGGIRHAAERAAHFALDRHQELVEAPGIQHVFQPRLVAVRAVAVWR